MAWADPLGFTITGGDTNDCTQCTAVMQAIRVPRIGPGRPRIRPSHIIGDKGYSSRANRTRLRERGIVHTVPERADQIRNRHRRGRRGGRPPAFDKAVHKRRNVVERCFNRLGGASPPATSRPPSPPGRRHPRITADVGLAFDDRLRCHVRQRLPCPLPAPRGDVPLPYARRSGARPARGNAPPSLRAVARERPTCQANHVRPSRVGRYRRATAPDRNSWRSTSSSRMRPRRPASNVGPCPARTG